MIITSYFCNFISCHLSANIPIDLEQCIAFDMHMLVSLYKFVLVRFNDEVAIVADPFLGVVLDANVLVLLSMHEDLLASFFVFKADFVESLTPFAAVGFDGGHRGVVGQWVGRLGLAIVHRTRDNRPIRVAIEE